MLCKRCGKQVFFQNAEYCIFCEKELREEKERQEEKKKKLVLYGTIAIIFILAGFFSFMGSMEKKKANEKDELQQVNIAVEFEKIGYTKEEAKSIEETLKNININKCQVVTSSTEAEDGMRVVACYFNNAKNTAFVSTVDNKVAVIGSDLQIWYDSEQNGIISNYDGDQNEVSFEAETMLMIIAEDMAKQIAKNPSTVRFQTMLWGFQREGRIYITQGTFTCSNKLGVSEEHVITVYSKATTDYSKIHPYKILLDGKIVKEVKINI